MATVTYTVKRGDTLASIAAKYKVSVNTLVKLNGPTTQKYIVVGQVLAINGVKPKIYAGSKKSSQNIVSIQHFGLQSNSETGMFASWFCGLKNTSHFRFQWLYETGDGVWFKGEDTTTTSTYSTYNAPSNARRVLFKVLPVSKTYKKKKGNKKVTVNYWTGSWSKACEYYFSNNPPSKPNAPTVKIDKFTLTAEVANLTGTGTDLEFEVIKDDTAPAFRKSGLVQIVTGKASYSCSVDAGGKYKVRCRSVRTGAVSDWSEYSSNVETIPKAPDKITTLEALSETSAKIVWTKVSNAKSYTIEYTTKYDYFDSSGEVKFVSVESVVDHAEITGMDSGETYYFRIQAVNDQGKSEWRDADDTLSIGTKPAAPTTWSSTTTAIVGESLYLYWVHNTQDGSSQKLAELELNSGTLSKTYVIEKNGEYKIDVDGNISTIKEYSDEDENRTTSVEIDTNRYLAGASLDWRVRTAGITMVYGDWSMQRTVNIYAPPTLQLTMKNLDGNEIEVLESFPFIIEGIAGPNTQAPIGYSVSIISNETYETVDRVGNELVVSEGDAVYTKYFDTSNLLLLEFTASDVDLENGVSYTVIVIVSMNSGLTAESKWEFSVMWTDEQYSPNAEIQYDEDTYSTMIRPFCEYYPIERFLVNKDETTGEYSETNHIVEIIENTGGEVENAILTRQRQLYSGIDVDGNPVYYYKNIYEDGTIICYEVSNDLDIGAYIPSEMTVNIQTGSEVYGEIIELCDTIYQGTSTSGDTVYYYEWLSPNAKPAEDVTLSVYRREYDGRYMEIASGIDNGKHVYITDPHPALDYARYRVVATTNSTGAVSYYDIPSYPIGETSIILQWDEDWGNFEITSANDTGEIAEPSWTGSRVILPGNIDVSENNKQDVSLVEYVGRSHPVSYYGTQLGTSATWNASIPKDDEETLYALRRLQIWMGDVYVREPSGTGYWANVGVSFSQKHRELTIPVTLNITRVEGGV